MKYEPLKYLELRPSPRREEALAEAERLARFLADEYGCSVWGIGSLFARDGFFSEESDIDLVVQGLPGDHFFGILARCDAMTSFRLDIIPLEDANALIRQTIEDPDYSARLI